MSSVIGDHKSGPHGTFVRLTPGVRLPLHHNDQPLAGVGVSGNVAHPVPGNPDSQQTPIAVKTRPQRQRRQAVRHDSARSSGLLRFPRAVDSTPQHSVNRESFSRSSSLLKCLVTHPEQVAIPASVLSLLGLPHISDDVPTGPVWWEETAPRNVNRLYPEAGRRSRQLNARELCDRTAANAYDPQPQEEVDRTKW